MRVALYVRVSTQEQAQKGMSIDEQLDTLRRFAEYRGFEIVGEYVDRGFSGGSDKRPQFMSLMADAKRHKFDYVAASKLDRFSRNLRNLLNDIHFLEECGIVLLAVSESLDTSTPQGKFSVQIMGVIAEFERGRIGERVAGAKAFRQAQGLWLSGMTLYGYKWLPDQQKFEIIQNEAEVVEKVFNLYVMKKLGTIRVAEQLNKDGHRTRKGGHWTSTHTMHILRNPAYKGQHEKGYMMPAIIDDYLWAAAQNRRKTARTVRQKNGKWLLQGLVVCGNCGHSYYCYHKDGNHRRTYQCYGRTKAFHQDGSERCQNSPRIDAGWIEKVVWYTFEETVSNNELLRKAHEARLKILKNIKSTDVVAKIDKELEKVKGKLLRLAETYSDGAIGPDEYHARLLGLKARESELTKRLTNLETVEDKEQAAYLENLTGVLQSLLDESTGQVIVSPFGVFGVPHDRSLPVVGLACNIEDTPEVYWDLSEFLEEITSIRGDPKRLRQISRSIMNNTFGAGKMQLIQNMRSILQLFQVKVVVYDDKMEIKGQFPTQTLGVLHAHGRQLKNQGVGRPSVVTP
ncbi:recombinase family protein [Chloroflexota bacterium]